jgi:glycosyltransferase involved in cell wall biosynthesis
MKIALVHPYPWPEVRRGAERYLDDLASYLAPRHQVRIVTGTHGRAREEERRDGVIISYHPHLLPGPLGRAGITEVETFGLRALRSVRAAPPDVVHAFTPSGALAGRMARRATLYTVLGHPVADQVPAQFVLRHLFAAAVHRATATATLSRASAEALRDTLSRDSVVLPPGVRLHRFPPELSPRTGPPRILFSASMADRRKRADLAVATLAVLLERHPDARLALSGEGDAAWVLSEADRHGPRVRAAVDVLGPGTPEDVPARYRAATVTLLPAEHEAFGLALVESLASGTPAVCPPNGGMRQIVDSPGVGKVADSATPIALAEAVEVAISLAARRETPARCVERARQWGWNETVGPAHETLYAHLASQSPVPTSLGPW